ncbi:MAG: AAA family ATPase [Thermoflexales bacterium]|nr:AAA family ATPase [Thermoflexales bacterium]
MYIRKIAITGIKCFKTKMKMDFTNKDGGVNLWNVIVSENGGGKSTLLQAVALALLNTEEIADLEELLKYDLANIDSVLKLEAWPSVGQSEGRVVAEISPGKTRSTEITQVEYRISRKPFLQDHIRYLNSWEWGQNDFAVGYGPFRRIGEDSDKRQDPSGHHFVHYNRESIGHGFGSLFDHRYPLIFIDQFDDIHYNTKNHFLQSMFPDNINYIAGNNEYLETVDGFVPATNLSDGYRTILALVSDITARMSEAYGHQSNIPYGQAGEILAEGAVLIDEIDAHLHPRWQQRIGAVLTKKFPNIQFIVATHSPFIPQVVGKGGSSVHALRRTKKGLVSSKAVEDFSLWQTDQILIELFGLNTTFSQEIDEEIGEFHELYKSDSLEKQEEKLERLEDALDKKLRQADLATEEVDRIRELVRELAFLWNRGSKRSQRSKG